MGLKPVIRRGVWAPPVGKRPVARFKRGYTSGPTTPLRLRASRERRSVLADLLPTLNVKLFSMALNEFAKEMGAGEEKQVLLVVDQAGWHTTLVGRSKFGKVYTFF